jgi:dsRNA-specific ribonuclease
VHNNKVTTQAGLTAQQQLAQAQATEEQQRLSQLGSGITSLIAGYPAQTQTQSDTVTKWISDWIRYSINTSRYLQIV